VLIYIYMHYNSENCKKGRCSTVSGTATGVIWRIFHRARCFFALWGFVSNFAGRHFVSQCHHCSQSALLLMIKTRSLTLWEWKQTVYLCASLCVCSCVRYMTQACRTNGEKHTQFPYKCMLSDLMRSRLLSMVRKKWATLVSLEAQVLKTAL